MSAPLRRHPSWDGREGGTHRIVAAQPLPFGAAQRLLVAIVDGRNAAHGEQDGRPQGGQLTADHAGYARDVMVAYEGERHEGPHEALVSLEAPVELKEVAILERAPDGLPQLVLSHRIHPGLPHDTCVVAVDHLPHEPGIGKRVPQLGQDARPEGGRHGVRRVEAPRRDAASHPMEHDVSHEASDPPRVVVERRELSETLERRVVGRSVGSARNGEQVLVSPSGEGVLE